MKRPSLCNAWRAAVDRVALVSALAAHVGEASGIHAEDLARVITGDGGPAAQRRLRAAIEELRREGFQICGRPETGYFLADTEAELNRTCNFLYDRAMTGLAQVAAMKRVALPELRGQLQLPASTGDV